MDIISLKKLVEQQETLNFCSDVKYYDKSLLAYIPREYLFRKKYCLYLGFSEMRLWAIS